MRCSKKLGNEQGAVMVLVAILLVVLIGMAALAIDIGQMYIARQRAQNVCDAAALAGVQELAMHLGEGAQAKTSAEWTASMCASANNEVLESWQVEYFLADVNTEPETLTLDDKVTTVDVGRYESIRTSGAVTVNFGFARIFGFTEPKRIGAEATAAITVVRNIASTKLIPLATSQRTIFGDPTAEPPWPEMRFGDEMPDLHVKWLNQSDTEFSGPGNFGCLQFEGDSIGDFSARLAGLNENDIAISVPMMASTLPGNRNPQVYTKGLEIRMDTVHSGDPLFADDSTAWDNWLASQDPDTGMYPDTARIVIVPITGDTVNGKAEVEIIGFAGFFIESVVQQQSDVIITGRFIQGLAIGDDIRWVFPSGEPTDSLQMIKSVRLIS